MCAQGGIRQLVVQLTLAIAVLGWSVTTNFPTFNFILFYTLRRAKIRVASFIKYRNIAYV